MASNKYERYVRLFPKTFRPQDGDEVINNLPPDDTVGKTIAELWNSNITNPIINAVLRGFAEGDTDISNALQETKAQLFVKTASGQFLDVIASSLGVSRPSALGLSDEAFRNVTPALSLRPKQVRQSFYAAMDAFWGPEFSRANIETVNTTLSTFDLRIDDVLVFNIDTRDPQPIVIRSTSGIANLGSRTTPGQATALELNNLIKDNIVGVTSEILVDPITKIETIRVLTLTPGLRGSIQFRIDRPDETDVTVPFTHALELSNASTPSTPFNPTTQISIVGDFRSGPIRVGDSLLIESIDGGSGIPDVLFSRTILEIGEVLLDLDGNGSRLATIITIGSHPPLDFTTASTLSYSRDVIHPEPFIFPTEKAELIKQNQRAVIYEINPNEVIIEIPAVVPTLARGLRGATHLHNGPLLNNLISRGEITNYILPDTLFLNNPDNEYKIMTDQTWFTYNKTTRTLVLSPPPGQKPDVYEFNVVDDANSEGEEFRFFVRVIDRLNPPDNQDIWVGAFVFDPNGLRSTFTLSGQSALIQGDALTGQDQLAAGKVFPRVTVDPETNTLPNETGLAIIGFGTDTQEAALIRYRGKASDSVILLDPSFIFTKTQPRDTYINIVSNASPFVPDRSGSSYPIYLTSSLQAREVIQGILETLAAAGVLVTFVIAAPEYKYLIDNPYLSDDGTPITN